MYNNDIIMLHFTNPRSLYKEKEKQKIKQYREQCSLNRKILSQKVKNSHKGIEEDNSRVWGVQTAWLSWQWRMRDFLMASHNMKIRYASTMTTLQHSADKHLLLRQIKSAGRFACIRNRFIS